MDADKNLALLLNFIYAIMPGVLIIIAGAIVLFFFNEEALKSILRLAIPLALYLSGIGAALVIRKRRSKAAKAYSGGSDQKTIYIGQMALFWHDALVFGVPCLIILSAYFINGRVEIFDILASAIACVGLYLSELIYRK